MASETSSPSPDAVGGAREQARRLAAAVDALEAELNALGPNADADTFAAALAEPVRAFDLAAKEA